ncbi:MAG: FAD-dependent oxidoreductase [Thermoplasmata archaeon]
MEQYDVVIVGAGPAGYTAGIYTGRYNLKTLVIGEMPGGMLSEAFEVCNFPSHDNISGMELMNKMEEQVKGLGVEVKMDSVESISGEDLDFTVHGGRGEYRCKKVILATGTERIKLGHERESELTGRGVSYCATCDAAFYGDKKVGVVGGGDSALSSALLLSEYAGEVFIIYRRDSFFRPEPIRIKEIEQKDNIKPLFNAEVLSLLGDERLNGAKIKEKNEERVLNLDGLFIEIGANPNSTLAQELGASTTDGGYIETDQERHTTVSGLYAAGDVIDSPLKQGITAAGQGAEAAVTVYDDLKKTNI